MSFRGCHERITICESDTSTVHAYWSRSDTLLAYTCRTGENTESNTRYKPKSSQRFKDYCSWTFVKACATRESGLQSFANSQSQFRCSQVMIITRDLPIPHDNSKRGNNFVFWFEWRITGICTGEKVVVGAGDSNNSHVELWTLTSNKLALHRLYQVNDITLTLTSMLPIFVILLRAIPFEKVVGRESHAHFEKCCTVVWKLFRYHCRMVRWAACCIGLIGKKLLQDTP